MSNAFESGDQKCIPAVLIYARFEDLVLMIHRGGKVGDYHDGKFNGLGGKLDFNESPSQAASREFFEESGLSFEPEQFEFLGLLQFPNFKAHKKEDWMVFVYSLVVKSADLPIQKTDEGSLEWIKQDQILKLPLWAGDKEFLPFVLNYKKFMGTLWYEGEKVSRFHVSGI